MIDGARGDASIRNGKAANFARREEPAGNIEDMPLPDLPLTLKALGSESPDDEQGGFLATIYVAPCSIGESDIRTSVLEGTLGGVPLRRHALARTRHSLNRISDGFGIPARCTPIGLSRGERAFASDR